MVVSWVVGGGVKRVCFCVLDSEVVYRRFINHVFLTTSENLRENGTTNKQCRAKLQ